MLSLVIPVYNEEKLIGELVSRTTLVLDKLTGSWELIFVDDGSTDNTLDLLLGYVEQNKNIRVLSLSKNFGHQAAYTAGLEFAKGDIVAMMDGDLQDPPELLHEMYEKLNSGDLDIVSGKKISRRGNGRRNFYSALFHVFFRWAGEMENMEDYGNFSMMRRNAVDALLMMHEKVRYIPGLRTYIGFRQGFVEFVRDERFSGKPKMTFRKLLILATDAVFSFSRFPVRFCSTLGIAGTLVFMIAGIYVLVAKLLGFAIPGWSSTLLSIYFLGSIQLLFLGVLGEYVFRNYREAQNRPVYFIRKIYGDPENQE